MRASGANKPLWKCPRCGHRFVTRNMWHSCGRFSLADHFKGKDPAVRRVYDKLTKMVRSLGPVTIYPQKTRIIFMKRMRFAGAVTRKSWLEPGLVLMREAEHPRLHKVERYPPYFVHKFRVEDPADLDNEFKALLLEAYGLGKQDHLRRTR